MTSVNAESSKPSKARVRAAEPPAPPSDVRVAVVEDDRSLRETIVAFINQSEEFSCLASWGSGEEALEKIPELNPDVVLMDIGLPGMSGIECVQALKKSAPQVQIVMHTVFDEGEFLFEALKAGASGYLLKRSTGTRLLESLREACHGGMPFTRQMAEQVQGYFRGMESKSSELDALAPREAETLRHLADGLPYKQIAERMGISTQTVRDYIKAIYTKLHVNSRTEAVVKYLRK